MTTAKIINDFKKNVDLTKTYELDELKEILASSYEKIKSTKKKEKVAREPTEYILFMKENMLALKKEKPELAAKDVMKAVAKMWSDKKEPKP
jgi:hypothetical protein